MGEQEGLLRQSKGLSPDAKSQAWMHLPRPLPALVAWRPEDPGEDWPSSLVEKGELPAQGETLSPGNKTEGVEKDTQCLPLASQL